MSKKLFIFLIIFSHSITNNAQVDSLKINNKSNKKFLTNTILPVSLITAGAIISGSVFEKNLNVDLRNAVGNNYQFKIDDYIQYAPIIEMYAADALGVKAKNHWFDQTKNLVISDALTGLIVYSLKSITNKTRPNGSSHAFPSGHTALAFSNAGVLYQEFKDSNAFLAYSGYGFATTTGVFRVLNNKHWVSDVLVGAGIGILIPQLVYHFEPLKNWNPFKNTKGITLVPITDGKHVGVYAQINF